VLKRKSATTTTTTVVRFSERVTVKRRAGCEDDETREVLVNSITTVCE
jgi:hypothetical protein